jgi:hypothetical protein
MQTTPHFNSGPLAGEVGRIRGPQVNGHFSFHAEVCMDLLFEVNDDANDDANRAPRGSELRVRVGGGRPTTQP